MHGPSMRNQFSSMSSDAGRSPLFRRVAAIPKALLRLGRTRLEAVDVRIRQDADRWFASLQSPSPSRFAVLARGCPRDRNSRLGRTPDPTPLSCPLGVSEYARDCGIRRVLGPFVQKKPTAGQRTRTPIPCGHPWGRASPPGHPKGVRHRVCTRSGGQNRRASPTRPGRIPPQGPPSRNLHCPTRTHGFRRCGCQPNPGS